MQAERIPTCRVKINATGDVAVINAAEFRDELHTRVREKILPASKRRSTEEPTVSRFTRADMARLAIPALKELPEYAKIDDPDKNRTKGELIAALMQARKKILEDAGEAVEEEEEPEPEESDEDDEDSDDEDGDNKTPAKKKGK